MRRRKKYLIKLITIPTVVLFVLLLIIHFTSSDGHVFIKRFMGETIAIPLFPLHVAILSGYVVSVIAGIIIFYQKIVWNEF